jgi:uncharacterized protein YdaU (DUF1376 family)
MKETSPSFQWYPDDVEGDENVILMNNAEFGLYIHLLDRCWKEGSIPDDVPAIARMTRTPLAEARRSWPKIRPCFKADEIGRLRHGRLDFERNKQAEYRDRQAKNGAKGGRPKYVSSQTQPQPTDNPPLNDGLAKTNPPESLPSLSPSPTLSPTPNPHVSLDKSRDTWHPLSKMTKTTKIGRVDDQPRVNIGNDLAKDESFGPSEVRPAVKYS